MLGPIGFAAPWVLTALIALPVLWVILRAMPPAPRQVAFPGVALLRGLIDKVPVARRTPWWLLLLRLATVAGMILAFAGPSWKPVVPTGQSGPLLVVLDAGWAAAPDWPARLTRAEAALSDAAANGRPAALMLACLLYTS
ncbi:BatA domain-containing protein, partial [Paracoccus fontiphilus]|uniref:BatA domain-containing protein n=1 Tax=Paracoccus fontiphilus TaxID=1815556 RepID=UPI001F62304F